MHPHAPPVAGRPRIRARAHERFGGTMIMSRATCNACPLRFYAYYARLEHRLLVRVPGAGPG